MMSLLCKKKKKKREEEVEDYDELKLVKIKRYRKMFICFFRRKFGNTEKKILKFEK